MRGHLRERSPGHWAIVIDVRDPATGERKRKWHSFRGTKRQAQIECARLISELQGGVYLEPSKTTLAQFLELWLRHMKTQISPKSHERYSEIVRNNIVPALGNLLIAKLTALQITTAYTVALSSGRRDGAGGLARSSVVYMHRLLKQALSQAVRWQILTRNPAEFVDPPKMERRTMITYDMAQTAELLEIARPRRLFIPVLLALLCGLRRGEIAALRWRHVDFDSAQLSISESAEQTSAAVRYKEPKSGKARTVALSAFVLEELRQHRLRQAEELLRLGIPQDDATFVYAREDGLPIQPRSLTQSWEQMIGKASLPRLRFHDLRHAHATHLLSSGVHPKIVSERLGHSKVGITLDLYSHVLPGMQADAVARVDGALRLALQKRATNAIR
jgi:integrase